MGNAAERPQVIIRSPEERKALYAKIAQKRFDFFCEHFVYIKVKLNHGGESIIKLVPNKPQRKLIAHIQYCLNNDLPIRVIILKARQQGLTTIVCAYFAWVVYTREGQNTFTVSYDKKSAAGIVQKLGLMWERCPDWIKPGKAPGGTVNEEILFASPNAGEHRSTTADNKSAGASYTFQHVHLSEFALYDNPEKIYDGIVNAVPMEPGTAVFIESTARAMGNMFHRMWVDATADESRSIWHPLFSAWFESPDYTMKIERLPEHLRYAFTKEELAYQAKYDLTDEQMYWYRAKYAEADDKLKFRREMPPSPEAAFMIGGDLALTEETLQHMDARAQLWEKKLKAELKKPKSERKMTRGYYKIDVKKRKVRFVESGKGSVKVFEKPVAGERYVVDGDMATGKGKDSTSIDVLRLGPGDKAHRQVVSYNGKCTPTEAAFIMAALSNVYNNAVMAPENNYPGDTTIDKLHELGYKKRIYRHTVTDRKTKKSSIKYGLTLSPSNREGLIDIALEYFEDDTCHIYDIRTVRELQTFIIKEEGNAGRTKMQAESGARDDSVMSLVHGLNVAKSKQARVPDRKDKPKKIERDDLDQLRRDG